MQETVVIIGGGAAGFFGAITCAEANPKLKVVLLEKTSKLLSKVRVSGGGRCNVTHACFQPLAFSHHYPRGQKALKKLLPLFGAQDTVNWFEQRGVKLKAEPDGRMFPQSNTSETIVDSLLQAARQAGVQIHTSLGVNSLEIQEPASSSRRFKLVLSNGSTLEAAKVLVSTGGSPKPEGYQWLQALGHTIEPPVPSLFTLNVPTSPFKDLLGVSVPKAKVKLTGQKLETEGPLLITHWGLSGPAVLRFSAWGARLMHGLSYTGTALVNWVPGATEEQVRQQILQQRQLSPRRTVFTNPLYQLPTRLWQRLCVLSEVPEQVKWAEMPGKAQNKLIELLLRTPFEMKGKTTFKEEFVTCGGIKLDELHLERMESRLVPGLFFAGEVVDIDGITGGFNFQAAWTGGYLAGKAMAEER
ncbi:NAD(P)/FAD-dependent oxidoreductase [Rufibacter glacialis]|uniref:NAD(P)/FAD-dependent oxidoreductase n=1 Tax=Rufibacter glacialis TaxID=1259555 RepID=A0A5M8Q7B3_9BACT|nr:NAD(P)/FAD-dependent oxidoreductase [Rufibacter glacialis]KAA6431815.1 NAD(P)/FAD-dependent oxidoreductase [Rufibacter glacialis]GGK81352.1 flavoprotein [Rufibacter glacialis]